MLSLDIFPAAISIGPPGLLTREQHLGQIPRAETPEGMRRVTAARVFVWNSTVHVVVDSPTGGTLVFREALTEELPREDGDKTYRFVTESGKTLAIGKDIGCGCGTRLRSFAPQFYVEDTPAP
jgi:hypothetical protein